jgi:hypothetical protein
MTMESLTDEARIIINLIAFGPVILFLTYKVLFFFFCV